MLAMHIIAHFFPIFSKISRSSDNENCKEEGDVDMEVEVDEVDEKW